MTKRTVLAVAAGVVAGATLVGVPAFAYADTDTGAADSAMEAGMDDPAFVERMKEAMTEMMSDPQMQQQMQDHMRDMGDAMGNMPPMDGMGGMHGHPGGDVADGGSDPGTP